MSDLTKMAESYQMGRKHCGKRRNCSLRAISPFPTVFAKGLFPRGVIMWEWVKKLLTGLSLSKANQNLLPCTGETLDISGFVSFCCDVTEIFLKVLLDGI